MVSRYAEAGCVGANFQASVVIALVFQKTGDSRKWQSSGTKNQSLARGSLEGFFEKGTGCLIDRADARTQCHSYFRPGQAGCPQTHNVPSIHAAFETLQLNSVVAESAFGLAALTSSDNLS